MLVGVIGLVLGSAFVIANIRAIDPSVESSGVPYVRLYDHPDNRLEVIVNQGDGQAFAALAQDPLLRRPNVFRAGPAEAAYRAQRPLLGWITWALSGGQAAVVPLVLVLLSLVGFALLGAVTASLLEDRGAPGELGLLVLLTPGALVTLDWTGPECIATAAAMIGLGLWGCHRHRWAVSALVAAVLFRESLLVVPVAIAAHALIVDRRPWRVLSPLTVPFLAYVGWLAAVWLRLDALPSDAGRGRLAAPFAGMVDAASGWGAADIVCATLILGVGIAAAVVGRRDPAGWVAGGFVLAALFFGADVWARLEDFSRVLLPVVSFSAVVLLPSWLRWRSATSPTLDVEAGTG